MSEAEIKELKDLNILTPSPQKKAAGLSSPRSERQYETAHEPGIPLELTPMSSPDTTRKRFMTEEVEVPLPDLSDDKLTVNSMQLPPPSPEEAKTEVLTPGSPELFPYDL